MTMNDTEQTSQWDAVADKLFDEVVEAGSDSLSTVPFDLRGAVLAATLALFA